MRWRRKASVRRPNLSNAVLPRTDLGQADLSWVDLTKADPQGCVTVPLAGADPGARKGVFARSQLVWDYRGAARGTCGTRTVSGGRDPDSS